MLEADILSSKNGTLIPNLLVVETDKETITLLSLAPGEFKEIERVPRPSDAPIPTKSPMVLNRRIIYRMEFYSVPLIEGESIKSLSKRARRLISEFKCKTGSVSGRPALSQIDVDRETMTRYHEVMEKNEAGLWETVHRHRDFIKNKRGRATK